MRHAWMRLSKNLPAVLPACLLLACLFGYYSTREAAEPGGPQKKSAAADQPQVDNRLLQTSQQLIPLAATPDEQEQAREAVRLADHELDLAFAAALREAEAAAKVPTSGPLKQLSDRIDRLTARVEADKQRAADSAKAAGADAELAQAQLDLDQDDLADAQQDLSREGGDQRAKLQRLLQEHEAEQKDAAQSVKFAGAAATGTLGEQLQAWISLGDYAGRLQAAAQQATALAKTLLEQHDTMERGMAGGSAADATVAILRHLSAQRKTLMGLDQQVQDSRQLAAVYGSWSALVESRRRGVLHLLLRSLAAILGILLATVLIDRAIRHAFQLSGRRRLHQLRVITGISLQVAAVLLILLIVFGPPTQLSTMLGLVTAGLTVVMRDFIVAFFGWFTLMGKNGISVGDWVEIEGVSGEVIEIGLLKTVLLELGNWTETGHPTGRRVAFSNSFAMERHYFNFSTTGQWLWDELQVPLHNSGDPYPVAQQIREIVERETQADAAEAAKDWERVTHQNGSREFSAAPAVSLRPGPNGLEVQVRYITRAPRRNAVKARLFQTIVEMMHKPA